MKRRSFVHLVAAVPPLAAQTLPPKSETAAVAPTARNEPIARNVETTPADTVCDSKPTFFTPAQLASLTRLCEILMPSGDLPGAIDAGVPVFLDFLIGASPAGVQQLYRSGLDGLEHRSRSRFGKAFARYRRQMPRRCLARLMNPGHPPRRAILLLAFCMQPNRTCSQQRSTLASIPSRLPQVVARPPASASIGIHSTKEITWLRPNTTY